MDPTNHFDESDHAIQRSQMMLHDSQRIQANLSGSDYSLFYRQILADFANHGDAIKPSGAVTSDVKHIGDQNSLNIFSNNSRIFWQNDPKCTQFRIYAHRDFSCSKMC